MCLAVPGKVVEIVDPTKRMGWVEVIGTPRLVKLGMLDDVASGDWVLVQLGLAVEKIDANAAQEALCLLEELKVAFEQSFAPIFGEEMEE